MLSELEAVVFNGDDYKTLLYQIFKHALDDYVKLQHPRSRSRAYLQEALDAAVDMFFDSDYAMLYVMDSSGEPLTLKTLVQELIEDDTVDLEKVKQYVVDEAYNYWENREMNTLFIPDSFVFQGHVYSIFQTEDEPHIDFNSKVIHTCKEDTTENQEKFMQLIAQVIFYHEDIPMAGQKLDRIGKSIFQALRMNSCFVR